jgi:hypothetical protein
MNYEYKKNLPKEILFATQNDAKIKIIKIFSSNKLQEKQKNNLPTNLSPHIL